MEDFIANPKRILVVEDEPTISELCQRVLASKGFEVDIAANGKIAQDMVEKLDYKLLLIDIWCSMVESSINGCKRNARNWQAG
ncbi:MAG TPA: response regulator [Dehalococcoidia bacterium]|jgi:DNA-binding response OmpR family regulator|nr:response regulator [Dehalococcoidia bacterium]